MSREWIIALFLIAFTIGTILGVLVAGNIYNEEIVKAPTKGAILNACYDGCYKYHFVAYGDTLNPSETYNQCAARCVERYWE